MPYNPNPPQPTPASTNLPKSNRSYPYNPQPEKSGRWQTLGYNTAQAQADRYSYLANYLQRLLPANRRSTTTAQQIFTRLRASRILPPFPKEADSKTLKRLVKFAYQYYAIGTPKAPLRLSLDGLNSLLVGGSE